MIASDRTKATARSCGAYLAILILLFAYLLIEFWPIAETDRAYGWDDVVTLPGLPPFRVADDTRLLFLVVLAAAIGSCMHGAFSFATYVGNKRFVASWTWWYLLQPFIGMALGLVLYLAMRSISPQSDAADSNVHGIALVAVLVGIFSSRATHLLTDKLEDVFTSLFRSEKGRLQSGGKVEVSSHNHDRRSLDAMVGRTMNDIFISYAREDRERAKALAQALKGQGWSVWWDRRIPTGKRYADVIVEAIAGSRCVVVLWSTVSITSDWVREEARAGARTGDTHPGAD